MKTFVIVFCAFLGLSALAQDPHGNFGLPAQDLKPEYQERGALVSIKLIPADKITKLFIVGNEAASVKFDKINITGKIRVGDNEKIIKFNREKDYFTTTDQLAGDLDLQLELKDKKKKEKFKIKLTNP